MNQQLQVFNSLELTDLKLNKARWWQTFFVVLQVSHRSLMYRKAVWFGLLIFAACVLILFPFAFGTDLMSRTDMRFGAFWAVQEFVVALSITRIFTAEMESGALEFWLASRAPRSAILMGKICYTALQMISLQVPMTILWIVFYNVKPEVLQVVLRVLIPVNILFSLGTASLGALIHCVTARSMAREILVPVLFYPLQIALLLASVTLCVKSDTASQVVGAFGAGAWWSILLVTPVIFSGMGFLLDNALLQE